jgi:hypothetical protein
VAAGANVIADLGSYGMMDRRPLSCGQTSGPYRAARLICQRKSRFAFCARGSRVLTLGGGASKWPGFMRFCGSKSYV